MVDGVGGDFFFLCTVVLYAVQVGMSARGSHIINPPRGRILRDKSAIPCANLARSKAMFGGRHPEMMLSVGVNRLEGDLPGVRRDTEICDGDPWQHPGSL